LSEADLPEFPAKGGASDVVVLLETIYANVFAAKKSRSDLRRLIEQGSVQLDGAKISDPKARLDLRAGQTLRLDKTRAVRIV
jgi:tyrosyl-tRNA synthetase